MNECENWRSFNCADGVAQYCVGTKDCESCTCDGDPSKCDFYESKRKEGNKMTTAEMIAEALNDGGTYVSQDYCSGGLWYNDKKGFHYDNGYSLKEIEDFAYFMNQTKWTKIGATVMSKEEAEKKFNIKIIG